MGKSHILLLILSRSSLSSSWVRFELEQASLRGEVGYRDVVVLSLDDSLSRLLPDHPEPWDTGGFVAERDEVGVTLFTPHDLPWKALCNVFSLPETVGQLAEEDIAREKMEMMFAMNPQSFFALKEQDPRFAHTHVTLRHVRIWALYLFICFTRSFIKYLARRNSHFGKLFIRHGAKLFDLREPIEEVMPKLAGHLKTITKLDLGWQFWVWRVFFVSSWFLTTRYAIAAALAALGRP